MLKKIILVPPVLLLVLLVPALVLVFLPDVPLEPGAQEWLTIRNDAVPDHDNLFNAIVGFTTGIDQEPAPAGAVMVAEANLVMQNPGLADEDVAGLQPHFGHEWSYPLLHASEEINKLCDPRMEDCREHWSVQKAWIEKILADHDVLIKRYRAMRGFHGYRNGLSITPATPLPELTSLLTINRLSGAAAALRYLAGEPVAALADLDGDMQFLRRLLAQADNFLIKMVAQAMLKHDLYLYASLMDAPAGRIEMFAEIPLLTPDERSLSGPVYYEFRLNAGLISELHNNPWLVSKDIDVPVWLNSALFRKNHSTNMVYTAFNSLLQESRLNAHDFFMQQISLPERRVLLTPGWWSYVYNPVGSILFANSLPDFDKYITRIHDLDALIIMVNLKKSIKQKNIAGSAVAGYLRQNAGLYADPYTGNPFNWNENDAVIWMQSPANNFTDIELQVHF